MRAADASKNELKPWREKMWCIPPNQDAAFVAAMEQVLQVYARPYDPARPVVCMDDQPKQLIREIREPVTASDGVKRVDHEYMREGVCHVWMFTEPLGGWRDVRVSERRTAVDWAQQIKALVDAPRYARAERLIVVCDQLNTHTLGSLYKAFDADEALRIANRIALVHTPKHSSWLNIGLVFDTGHAWTAGLDPAAEIIAAGDRLCATHLQDVDGIRPNDDHWVPTHGGLDWQAIRAALQRIDYDGEWTFEVINGRHGESREELAWLSREVAKAWGL